MSDKETGQIKDKAGEAYWTQYWQSVTIPPLLEPHHSGAAHFQTRQYHAFIRSVMPTNMRGKKVLEIGCANSVWLPYFHREFGMELYGLDYSDTGCEMERRLLENHHIPGTIIHGDFYYPPAELEGQMDMVVSMGVVEHFTDTAEVIRAFARYLKPGGLLLTTMPNMAGVTGVLQKWFYRPVYDIHVPVTLANIETAATRAGMENIAGEYGLTPSFYGVLHSTEGRATPYYLKWAVNKGLIYLTKLCWWIQTKTTPWPKHAFWSASIFHLCRKP